MLVRNYKDVEKVRYAEGIGKRVVIGPRQGAPTFVMRVFDLSPGVSTAFHTHDWEHEVFILAGQGVVVSVQGESPLRPDDVVFIPPDEKHCFRNTGADVLRFLCVVPLRGEDTP